MPRAAACSAVSNVPIRQPVAPKTSTPTAKRPAGRRPPSPIGIVVRRGALKRFDALTRKTAKLPVAVLWDRRVANRRNAALAVDRDRRKADRRRRPPFTWELADFVVVDPPKKKKKN
jgi:hypothetical protein